jgi:hypothetical protein
VPANAGGFGDVTKATDAFFELEIARSSPCSSN